MAAIMVVRMYLLLAVVCVAALPFGEGHGDCAHARQGILTEEAKLLGPYIIEEGVHQKNIKIPISFGCLDVALYVVSCSPTGRINMFFIDFNTVHIHRQHAKNNGTVYAIWQCGKKYSPLNGIEGLLNGKDKKTPNDKERSPDDQDKSSNDQDKTPYIAEGPSNAKEQKSPNDKETSLDDQDKSPNDQDKTPHVAEGPSNDKDESSPKDKEASPKANV